MKKPVVLPHRTFATQGECHNHFRHMRARYAPGERLNAADHQDLAALLERNPDRAQLIGDGMAGFAVAADDFGAPKFAIFRTDGTRELFSLTACVTGRKPKVLPLRVDEPGQAYVPRTPLRVDPPVPASNLFRR